MKFPRFLPALSSAALLAVALLLVVSPRPAVADPPSGKGTFVLDPAHASVSFEVMHLETTHIAGLFTDTTGGFTLDHDNPSASSFNVTIKVDSIYTGQPKRDGHLKSPDFFNAVEFPTITFKSTKVAAGPKPNTYEVTGDLTLHGVTQPLTITVSNPGQAEMGGQLRSGVNAEFTVKRADFGMKKFIPMVSDEVKLSVGLEGIKQ